MYLFIGYALVLSVLNGLPTLLLWGAAYAGLCGVLALERSLSCRRVGRALEDLLTHQLMPVLA